MIEVIKTYPLATVISVKDNQPLITHLPLIYEDQKLIGHIDIYNPQAKLIKDNNDVTILFSGPECYISPSIYSTTQLPTWNYIIVHIKGIISLINDPEEAKETMIAMTKFLEGKEQKFVLEKDNRGMRNSINYIQAFEITITDWEGKFKLSQDKKQKDQENAKQELIKKSREDITGFFDDLNI